MVNSGFRGAKPSQSSVMAIVGKYGNIALGSEFDLNTLC